MANERNVEEDVVAVCVECFTPLSNSQAEKDPFLAGGQNGVCRACGGPVVVTYAGEIEKLRQVRSTGKNIV